MDTLYLPSATGPRIHPLTRNSSILAVLIGLLALPLTAQPQLAPHPNQPPRTKVTGKVINSLTDEPINRALVTVNGRETRFILTDDDGSFTLEGLSGEIFTFSAKKPGFYEISAMSASPKNAEDVLLKLTPAAVIIGRVVGVDEEPLEHAVIQLYSQVNMEGRRRWVPSGSAQTDEEGRFRVPNLRAGSYLVGVGPFQNRGIAGEVGYASVYFPNAPDRPSASPIRVSAGQQTEVNFSISPVHLFNLTGRIVGPPAAGINLSVADSSGIPLNIPAVANPRTGMFQIRGIPRGTFTIRANAFQQGGNMLRAHLSVTVTSDRNDILLSLQPPISIPIVIRRETVEGRIAPHQAEPSISVRAISLDNEEQQAYSGFEGPPEQGHLALNNLDPGRYRVSVSSYGDSYIQSASIGGINLLSEPLVVTGSSPNNPIEIVVRNDAANIRVLVRGDPGRASIIALPDRGESPQPIVGTCIPEGGCFMSGAFAPGNYTVYAFDRLDNVEYSNRKALESYSSKAAHVTLSPNQTTDVTLDIIRTEQ